jgi:arsenate reductase
LNPKPLFWSAAARQSTKSGQKFRIAVSKSALRRTADEAPTNRKHPNVEPFQMLWVNQSNFSKPMLKLYTYQKCSTCRSARKFLEARGIAYQELPIRETPPPPAELARMLRAYDGKMTRLFNTSSQDYRDAGLKDTLPSLSQTDAFARLQQNGNLVKRPFLLGDDVALVGFKEPEWTERLRVGLLDARPAKSLL